METGWTRHILVLGAIATFGMYLSADSLHAQENVDDLRTTVKKQSEQLEKQRVQLETLQQRLDAMSDDQNVQPVAATTNAQQP